MSRYLTVAEVAKALGVSISAIKQFDKRGSLIPTVRTAAGVRLYDAEVIAARASRPPPKKLGTKIR